MPEMQGKAKYATTGRRNPQAKPRNLYKFLKVCFPVHVTLGAFVDELYRSRLGTLATLSNHVKVLSRWMSALFYFRSIS
jgi:hypothetical protein